MLFPASPWLLRSSESNQCPSVASIWYFKALVFSINLVLGFIFLIVVFLTLISLLSPSLGIIYIHKVYHIHFEMKEKVKIERASLGNISDRASLYTDIRKKNNQSFHPSLTTLVAVWTYKNYCAWVSSFSEKPRVEEMLIISPLNLCVEDYVGESAWPLISALTKF